MRVLLAEDDSMIGDSIRQGLQHDGYTVDWVHDGEAAELTARLRAVLRRQSGCADLVVTYGGITLNPATYQVTWQGQPSSSPAGNLRCSRRCSSAQGPCCRVCSSKSGCMGGRMT